MAEPITLDSIVIRSEELLASEMDGETVMMSIAKGRYYGLDAIGTRVWSDLAQPLSVHLICASLEREFDVTAEQCQKDILSLLHHMAAEDLVRVINE